MIATVLFDGRRDDASIAGSVDTASVQVISERAFTRKVEAGWRDRGDHLFAIGVDSTAPVSPPFVGVATFPRGYESGSGPISTSLELQERELTELHITVWLRLSREWFGNDAGPNKVFYLWHHDRPAVAITAFGSGTSPLELQVRLQNTPGGARNLRPNRALGRVQRGEWQRWDFVLIANTPGSADGTVRWWVDGIEAGHYWDVEIGGADEDRFWQRLAWNPTYGGKGPPVPYLQTMSIDHLIVSGR